LIGGDRDPSLAPMKVIYRKIRGSKLVVLSPASHFANRDQPDAWNRAALQFLARVDRARRPAWSLSPRAAQEPIAARRCLRDQLTATPASGLVFDGRNGLKSCSPLRLLTPGTKDALSHGELIILRGPGMTYGAYGPIVVRGEHARRAARAERGDR